MAKILVPTDFSKEAGRAFSHARSYAELVGTAKADLVLLSVLEDLIPASVTFEFGLAFIDTQGLMEEAYKQATAKLADLAKEYFAGFRVTAHVIRATQPVHEEILGYARSEHADLIVMSTHGRTGFRRFVVGSVAERVVRESPCPVLVIPGSES